MMGGREFWIRDQYKSFGITSGAQFVAFEQVDREGIEGELIKVREVRDHGVKPSFKHESPSRQLCDDLLVKALLSQKDIIDFFIDLKNRELVHMTGEERGRYSELVDAALKHFQEALDSNNPESPSVVPDVDELTDLAAQEARRLQYVFGPEKKLSDRAWSFIDGARWAWRQYLGHGTESATSGSSLQTEGESGESAKGLTKTYMDAFNDLNHLLDKKNERIQQLETLVSEAACAIEYADGKAMTDWLLKVKREAKGRGEDVRA